MWLIGSLKTYDKSISKQKETIVQKDETIVQHNLKTIVELHHNANRQRFPTSN
jgi:hypothetical protein